MFEIAIGAVSGIVASAFIFLLKILTEKYFIPLFQSLSYRGSLISGRWELFSLSLDGEDDVNITDFSMLLDIKQKAYKVEGIMFIDINNSDEKRILNYSFSGQFSEGYLQVICQARDKGISSYASLLLKVVSSGRYLEGIMAFRNAPEDKVDYMKIKLKLDNN